MTQLASYKRYWEPNMAQVLGISLPVGAMITLITHPIEFVKTRIQVRTEGVGIMNKNQHLGVNAHKVFREIHETGTGIRGFYVGIQAALLSRVGYLAIRNVLYKSIYDYNKPVKASNDLSSRQKAVISGTAGAIAAFITNPFELIMIRQVADGGLPSFAKRNYQGFSHAYQSIVALGGTKGLFKGASATVFRAAAINASLTGPYDYLREKMWITFGDFGFIDPIATVWASFWATIMTLPIDNIKTRMQRANEDPTKNRMTYKNLGHCIQQALRYEGLNSLYVGAYPYFAKMLITCFLTTNVSNSVTDSMKRSRGLKEWQI